MNTVLNSERASSYDVYNVVVDNSFSFQHKSLGTIQKEWTKWKR
ncbi:hypothetical protein P4I81_10160 [Bacillus cereus]|uniref:Uncharacterized protein n=1 Tax=Bacillus thuringiensis serovar toumanoffi TaxID=180862 RepID=A0ABD5I8L0_BACTU|nr:MULTISPECIES: hypothetical protein [Bacillus cereus group]EEM93049.1 Pesticidal crystal protein cry2Ad [Bacillus thuringiensis IBL 200]MCU5280561.1 hypothetical protein [Bacillus cereus]MDW9213631.1 hypothetical protein [Bacillus thuringiensis serovar toumanoffi]MEB8633696.1 hypothetical protein [Bacillus cereus]MEB8745685.1 hypothetical protein [Bacillus cereus]